MAGHVGEAGEVVTERKNWSVSFMKDEKVVNPPRKPVISRAAAAGEGQSFAKKTLRNPITREPSPLTNQVP